MYGSIENTGCNRLLWIYCCRDQSVEVCVRAMTGPEGSIVDLEVFSARFGSRTVTLVRAPFLYLCDYGHAVPHLSLVSARKPFSRETSGMNCLSFSLQLELRRENVRLRNAVERESKEVAGMDEMKSRDLEQVCLEGTFLFGCFQMITVSLKTFRSFRIKLSRIWG